MKKKIVWLILSCLMVAALLLASCTTAVTEEEEEVVTEEEEEVITEEEEEEVVTEEEEEVVTPPGGPQYGGTITMAYSTPIGGFDETVVYPWEASTINFTNEELMTRDWARGPSGTGEASFQTGEWFEYLEIGLIAESWEVTDNETTIWHIRKGIHYSYNPDSEASKLVNGRELNADDVVYSLERQQFTPGSYMYLITSEESRAALTFTATDDWTVVRKTLPSVRGTLTLSISDFCRIIPPEVPGKYGDMNKWENVVGSGPFMIADSVPMSSTTLIKNPNYWREDPVNPGYILPYVDTIQILIISDASTRLSAFRTGKLDRMAVGREDYLMLIETNPELEYIGYVGAYTTNIWFRVDKPELPYDDILVRQALNYAVNNQEMLDELYGGEGRLYSHPVAPMGEYSHIFTEFEDLPESVQKLYGYYPEEAKQLLIDAGYPDGFKCSVVCTSGGADTLSIIKEYWAAIDVTLTMDTKESTVFTAISSARSHEDMILHSIGNANPAMVNQWTVGSHANYSWVDDERIADDRGEMFEIELGADGRTTAEWNDLTRALYVYGLTQAWSVEMPTGFTYIMWQPWLKGHSGESFAGYIDYGNSFMMYAWIDQDVKTAMGY